MRARRWGYLAACLVAGLVVAGMTAWGAVILFSLADTGSKKTRPLVTIPAG